jgi:hypothetical protein
MTSADTIGLVERITAGSPVVVVLLVLALCVLGFFIRYLMRLLEQRSTTIIELQRETIEALNGHTVAVQHNTTATAELSALIRHNRT